LPALTDASAFATREGKPLAIPEWGLALRGDGHGLGDDPSYVNDFIAWMKNPTNNVAYESYFNFDVTGQIDAINDGNSPTSLTAFIGDLGGSTVVAPPVVTPPVVVAPPVVVTPAVVTPVVPVAPAPSVPGAVTGLTKTVSATTVTLKWTNPVGTQGDDVYRNGVEIAWPGYPTAVVSTYGDVSMAAGSDTYQVAAYDGAGVGAKSNSVTATIGPSVPVVAPAAVSGLSASVNGTTVALSWSNPTGTTGNRVYLNGALRATLTSASTSFADIDAPLGWHTYNVTAYNAAGEGAQSNSVTLDILAPVASRGPRAVTHLSATANGTTVTLKWTNPSGSKGNAVYLNGILRKTLTTAVSTYTDTNAPTGWHTYNVTASNAAGQGTMSNSVTLYIGSLAHR
jgi:hypothetical protein